MLPCAMLGATNGFVKAIRPAIHPAFAAARSLKRHRGGE